MFRNLIYFLVFFSVFLVNGQELNIVGIVKDSLAKKPIDLVSLVLYKYKTNQIIAYTSSSNDGSFTIKTDSETGIYTLKTNHLGYQPVENQIVISENSDVNVNVDFELVPKVNQLDEIILKKAPPIIIKKDTIIYDIKHWAQKNDQTLEEVLAKVTGFKILPNGEIEVNGKPIRKVLLNNKEVANAGAAIITKSLDPNDVDKIVVRLNEQENRIKESLLDTREYVVLDIQLKKNVNTSLFGKIRTTAGYLNQLRLGGYANIFSINKKANFHLFAEHDNFGHQTISLDQIRNIGKEAFQKNFELPADFQTLTEREDYQSEIYGFDDYTLAGRNIVGFTSMFEITKGWTIFIGSYNTLNNTHQFRSIEQKFESITQNFEELKKNEIATSKNKVEFRFNSSKTKLRFDTNIIYESPNQKTITDFSNPIKTYDFHRKKNITSMYTNIHYEQRITSKLGLELKTAYSSSSNNKEVYLMQNNLNSLFSSTINKATNHVFTQNIDAQNKQTNVQFTTQYQSRLGIIKLGNLFENKDLIYHSVSEVTDFSQKSTSYNFQKIKPFLYYEVELGSISLSNKIGYSILEHSTVTDIKKKFKNLDYYSMISFSGYEVLNDVSISYNNRLSPFPLHKLTKAKTRIDFQTQEIQATNIVPKRESGINFSLFKKFNVLELDLDLSFLFGNSNNTNSFSNFNPSILESQRAQLKNGYKAFSIYFTKRLKNKPITFIFEPEAVFNSSENLIEDVYYQISTKRYLLGFKTNTNFKERWYNINLYPKYTRFEFENSLSKTIRNQDMLSFFLNTKLKLFNDKLFIDLGIRRVDFFRGIKSDYTNLNAMFSGDFRAISWFLSISNVSNDLEFIQQHVFPSYFISQSNAVFGRYVKFGMEYKFK